MHWRAGINKFSHDMDANQVRIYLGLTPMAPGKVVLAHIDPERGPIYYKASIHAQGLPEPSSLRGSTLGTKAAEHKGCNWGMQVD